MRIDVDSSRFIAFRNYPTFALDAHTTYYARVQAINSKGASSWSSTVTFTTGTVTSSDDKFYTDFRAYPVPVMDFLNIEYPPHSIGTRKIFTSGGVLFNTNEIYGEPEIMDMTGTSPGIYIIQFSDGKKNKSLRIVKE